MNSDTLMAMFCISIMVGLGGLVYSLISSLKIKDLEESVESLKSSYCDIKRELIDISNRISQSNEVLKNSDDEFKHQIDEITDIVIPGLDRRITELTVDMRSVIQELAKMRKNRPSTGNEGHSNKEDLEKLAEKKFDILPCTVNAEDYGVSGDTDGDEKFIDAVINDKIENDPINQKLQQYYNETIGKVMASLYSNEKAPTYRWIFPQNADPTTCNDKIVTGQFYIVVGRLREDEDPRIIQTLEAMWNGYQFVTTKDQRFDTVYAFIKPPESGDIMEIIVDMYLKEG